MDVGEVLRGILIVLVAAKVAAEIAERIGLSAVVAEILAGVLIGPSALHLVEADDVLRVLGELGVILLLLEVGLQTDLKELRAVGRASLAVAALGVALPMAGGAAVAASLGHSGAIALFLGAALTATSVGITARVFADLRALGSIEARTVLGAAVADDVLGLVILTVVVRIVGEGSISPAALGTVVLAAVGFLVVATGLSIRIAPPVFAALGRAARSPGTIIALALAFTLAVAEIASVAKLAPIVGAFVAGLALARSDQADRIRRELTPVGHLFIPVFFLQIGIDADISAFTRPSVLGLAAALMVVAVIGKVAAGAGALGIGGDRLTIGLGMLPRGEVGLIFAGVGLREGVLGGDTYAALLVVVLSTTLMTPGILSSRMRLVSARRRAGVVAAEAPPGGWVRGEGEVLELAASPPPELALHVALQVALLATRARPGPTLTSWFADLPDEPPRWDPAATRELFEVLRWGNARSWRFLEATGVIEHALPEVAGAIRRRRADPFELDPAGVMHWDLVESVRALLGDNGVDVAAPELLLLAAFAMDLSLDPVGARGLAGRLDVDPMGQAELVAIVEDADLMLAAARRPEGLAPERVLQIASHLQTGERARSLYLLTRARVADEEEADRLEALYAEVEQALQHPELTGPDSVTLDDQRRSEAFALASDPRVADRILHTPRAHLLQHDAAIIAGQAALLEPLPRRTSAHVRVSPNGSPDRWRVEIGLIDRPGLLATVTGALAEASLDVLDASAATWGDGGAVESFVVGSRLPPGERKLRLALEEALGQPLASAPVPGAVVTFDDRASPFYTVCHIEAPDRRGVLHDLTTALAASGATVHTARVVTEDRRATDTFEVTDLRGRKLDEATKALIVRTVAGGVTPRPTTWWRRRHRSASSGAQSRHAAETIR